MRGGCETSGNGRRRPADLRSLSAELREVPDFRRAQGRKMASVRAVQMRARKAAAADAQSLSQNELQALGAGRTPPSGRAEPVSKSVLWRVLEKTDTAALEAVLRRSAPATRGRAANRNGPQHHQTVTLVAHSSGLPLASLGYHDQSSEIAAVRALFGVVPRPGRGVALAALPTVRDTARALVDAHRAEDLLTIKAHAEQTFQALRRSNRARGHHADEPTKCHRRVERRSIRGLSPPAGSLNCPHLPTTSLPRRA